MIACLVPIEEHPDFPGRVSDGTCDITTAALHTQGSGTVTECSVPDITEPTPNPLRLEVFTNETATGSFSFGNDGTADLTYTVSPVSATLGYVGPKSGTVTPGGQATIEVDAYCRDVAETRTFTVSITSNDPDEAVKGMQVELTCKPRTRTRRYGRAGWAGSASEYITLRKCDANEIGVFSMDYIPGGEWRVFLRDGSNLKQPDELIEQIYYSRCGTDWHTVDFPIYRAELERVIKAWIDEKADEAYTIFLKNLSASERGKYSDPYIMWNYFGSAYFYVHEAY